MDRGIWEERCVQHYGDDDVHDFLDAHFSQSNRTCILIAGAGFDPRSAVIAECLSNRLGGRLRVILIRERRPDPDNVLVELGDQTVRKIESLCEEVTLLEIDIFASDNTVVGGRKVVAKIDEINFQEAEDVILDTSAMSIGVSFPVAKYLFDDSRQEKKNYNFHVMLASNPELDSGPIRSEPNDIHTEVRGFELGALMSNPEMPKFWLPLVSEKKLPILKIIHRGLVPEDVCPILPFPSERDPKKTDRIASALWNGIEREIGGVQDNDWGLDPKNFVYAGERNPLDIYRTILRIQRERAPVFQVFGGSELILSPMGSKVPALGALMAAMEKGYSVVYVESLKYTLDDEILVSGGLENETKLSHIWLVGEAYL